MIAFVMSVLRKQQLHRKWFTMNRHRLHVPVVRSWPEGISYFYTLSILMQAQPSVPYTTTPARSPETRPGRLLYHAAFCLPQSRLFHRNPRVPLFLYRPMHE